MTTEHIHTEGCCNHTVNSSLTQTLEELDFERSLHSACAMGDVHKVKKFLEKGCAVNQLDKSGYAPLHYTARQGNLIICKLLIENGAEVNLQTPELGSTPLHRAVVQGHLDIVKLLLSVRANLSILNREGENAANLSLKYGQLEISNFLRSINPDIFSSIN